MSGCSDEFRWPHLLPESSDEETLPRRSFREVLDELDESIDAACTMRGESWASSGRALAASADESALTPSVPSSADTDALDFAPTGDSLSDWLWSDDIRCSDVSLGQGFSPTPDGISSSAAMAPGGPDLAPPAGAIDSDAADVVGCSDVIFGQGFAPAPDRTSSSAAMAPCGPDLAPPADAIDCNALMGEVDAIISNAAVRVEAGLDASSGLDVDRMAELLSEDHSHDPVPLGPRFLQLATESGLGISREERDRLLGEKCMVFCAICPRAQRTMRLRRPMALRAHAPLAHMSRESDHDRESGVFVEPSLRDRQSESGLLAKPSLKFIRKSAPTSRNGRATRSATKM